MKKTIIFVLVVLLVVGMTGQAIADMKDWFSHDEAKEGSLDLSDNVDYVEDNPGHNSSHIDDLDANVNHVLVYVDGKKVTFPDVVPFVNKDNRTLIPVRAVVEEMDCNVEWDGQKQLVTISKENTVIKLVIGEKKATVNGKEVTFDTKAEIIESRTFVPLRFVSETLGAKVAWVGEKRTVYIQQQ